MLYYATIKNNKNCSIAETCTNGKQQGQPAPVSPKQKANVLSLEILHVESLKLRASKEAYSGGTCPQTTHITAMGINVLIRPQKQL